jgi:CRISPR-associated protein Cst1
MTQFFIEARAEEWHFTAGLIGLMRLYEEEMETTPAGLLISKEQLDSLAERYFKYLFDTYNIAERDTSRMERLLQRAKNKIETCKERFADMRKIAAEQLKKVEKYFPNTKECQDLKQLVEEMKEFKGPEHIEQAEKVIEKYRNIMIVDSINKKLTINYAKAVIISPYYGQPSFLQRSCNALNYEEHVEKMHKEFVLPAQLEIEFKEKSTNSESIDKIKNFLDEHQEYAPFKGWLKTIKKKSSVSEIKEWFHDNVIPCSFMDDLPATMSYEEMMFLPLGVSNNNASNFHWNFNKKNPIPMSALARLILFLVPVGVAFYQRKLGSGPTAEYKRYAGLILKDERFIEIYNINNYYRNVRQTGSSFSEAVVGLLADTKERAEKKANSFLFVELHSEGTKKTLLDYYHMPEYCVQYLKSYGNRLKLLLLTDERDLFIRNILSGVDPKQAVFRYLREAIKQEFHAQGAYFAVRERYRILLLKQGVNDLEEMKKQDSRVSSIYIQGMNLRRSMITSRESSEEAAVYKASGKKKIDALAYRLLNAVKAGNRTAFLDTVFRLHIAEGEELSPVFMDVYKSEGLDFETIGGAFIAGLLGKELTKKGDE